MRSNRRKNVKKEKQPKEIAINVAGYPVSLEQVVNLKSLSGDYGSFEEHEDAAGKHYVVKVDANLEGHALFSTLAHELTHAVLHISGVANLLTEKTEEAIVRSIEHFLLPALAELHDNMRAK